MARIRTIKPEFFRHNRLYLAEKESRLPLRVAFAGLWTVADRDGRFKWRPIELKLDCLPYDRLNFSRVLDALATRGFVTKYIVDDVAYGYIPSFPHHQIINNRERESVLPEPNKDNIVMTRASRVPHASGTRSVQVKGEGKGREGKGREHASRDASAPADFLAWYEHYPFKTGKQQAVKTWKKLCEDGTLPELPMLIEAVKAQKLWPADANSGLNPNRQFKPHPSTWLNQGRWEDEEPAASEPASEKKKEPTPSYYKEWKGGR